MRNLKKKTYLSKESSKQDPCTQLFNIGIKSWLHLQEHVLPFITRLCVLFCLSKY